MSKYTSIIDIDVLLFVNRLLLHYEQMEKNINVSNETPGRFCCHREFSQNCTKFETLSNSNKILLKTRFEDKYVPVLMLLFQSVLDKDYHVFETTEYAENIYLRLNLEMTNEIKTKLMLFDIDIYLDLFDKLFQTCHINDKFKTLSDCVSNTEKDVKSYYIGTNEIAPTFKYFQKDSKKPKVYTINILLREINDQIKYILPM